MKEKNLKIALIDSGSGGLAILNGLIKKLPHAHFDYLCDNLFFPFGEQESSFIRTRFVHIATDFYEKNKPDLLVIPCNTASTMILDDLRQKISIPVVGVVPAIKTASQISQSKIVGILATKTTIESPYLDALIKEFASDCRVLKKASPTLVTLSEKKIGGLKVDEKLFNEEIKDFLKEEKLDTVVLGCTHFSQLIPELEQASAGKNIQWIDSTEAIIKRVLSLLPPQLSKENEITGSIKIFYTKDTLNKDSWRKFISSPVHSFHLFP
jgi:glutamate racemase